jgi:hypothetical protein
VVLYRRLTASTRSRAPERTRSRSGQPRNSPLLEEGLGRDPEVVAPEPYCGLRQHRRSGGAGGSRPAPSGTSSGGNGCWLDNLQLCLSKHGPPGGGPALLQWPHEGTTIRSAFSMLPEEHPIGLLRRPLPDISVRRRMAHRRDARLGRSPIEPLPASGGRRPPRRPGASLAAEAASPPGGGWPANGPGASAWTCKQVSVKPAQGGCGKGVSADRGPSVSFSGSVPVMMLAEARLTASGRSLSPEHPEVSGQRKTLGNRNIQLSLPFG